MLLIIILLIISVGLNIALIFGIVRRHSDEDIEIIRMREGLKIE
jgi:hypothetical protein